jgi:hypothetical protein
MADMEGNNAFLHSEDDDNFCSDNKIVSNTILRDGCNDHPDGK